LNRSHDKLFVEGCSIFTYKILLKFIKIKRENIEEDNGGLDSDGS